MATTEEQKWAGRLRAAWNAGTIAAKDDGDVAVARLVLADRAALRERAERAEAELAKVREQRDGLRESEGCTIEQRDEAEAEAHAANEARRVAEADRDRLASELEAVRGSVGVLTREECAALLGSRSGLVYGDESPAVNDAQAGARAQHARDVAMVREALADVDDRAWSGTDVKKHVLAALTSDAAPAVHPWTKQLELDRAMADLDAARAEVARLKAEVAEQVATHRITIGERDQAMVKLALATASRDDVWFWQPAGGNMPETLVDACPVVMSAETLRGMLAHPTPPADLDGYVRIYLAAPGYDYHRGIAAVIAARDAWWEERLKSEEAVRAAVFAWRSTPGAGTTTYAEDAMRAAIRAAIAAVRTSGAAPAPAQPPGTPSCDTSVGLGNARNASAGARDASSGGDGPETPALSDEPTPDDVAAAWRAYLAAPADPSPDLPNRRMRAALLADRLRAPASIDDLSTALGAPPGESWDELLDRVRSMKARVPLVFATPGTHEERVALGRAAYLAQNWEAEWDDEPDNIREGYEIAACYAFATGVEAALAAAQSEEVWRAVDTSDVNAADIVTAARRVVRVPAKEEPAPTTPPADLDGYVDIYDEVWRTKTRIDGIAAVIAAGAAPAFTAAMAERSTCVRDVGHTGPHGVGDGTHEWANASSGGDGPMSPALFAHAVVERARERYLAERTQALATALIAKPGESWDALLGRVRGLVAGQPSFTLDAAAAEICDVLGMKWEGRWPDVVETVRFIARKATKEAPAPTAPPALSAEERERLAQVARETFNQHSAPRPRGFSDDWRRVIDAVWTACAKAGSGTVAAAPAPPLPEVPDHVRQYANMHRSGYDVASLERAVVLLVDLVDALRARGGL